jgi:type I restriction enzyme S subunit
MRKLRHYFLIPWWSQSLVLIPDGWIVSGLETLASVRYGAPFASTLFNTDQDGTPLIRIRDLKNQSIATWSTENHTKAFLASGGDLLIGMDGEFNPTLWFGEDALVNQRICKIEPKEFVSNFYLYFTLIPIMRKIEHGSTGSTCNSLGQE